MSRKVRLSRAIGKTGDVAYELSSLHFSKIHHPVGWVPEINAYEYDNRYEIWVDLAGVDKKNVNVDILPERLRITGVRNPPTPTRDASSQCKQVMTMEIENGHFEREVELLIPVDREKVSAKLENGLLWIVLPFENAHLSKRI
ncbi:MAG: Hsp20/alpha crystallin family protein [Verrucomicrobiota bacterium]